MSWNLLNGDADHAASCSLNPGRRRRGLQTPDPRETRAPKRRVALRQWLARSPDPETTLEPNSRGEG